MASSIQSVRVFRRRFGSRELLPPRPPARGHAHFRTDNARSRVQKRKRPAGYAHARTNIHTCAHIYTHTRTTRAHLGSSNPQSLTSSQLQRRVVNRKCFEWKANKYYPPKCLWARSARVLRSCASSPEPQSSVLRSFLGAPTQNCQISRAFPRFP